MVADTTLDLGLSPTIVTTAGRVVPMTGPRAVINAADRLAARITFERPPGNRTPDIDPPPFTANPLGLRLIIKGPEQN